MADKKYSRNIIYNPKPDANPRIERTDAPGVDVASRLMYINDEYVKGAFYTEVDWLMKGYPDKIWVKAHVHNFDEFITF